MEEVARKEESANMYQYWYKKEDKETGIHVYRWITNIELTKRNLEKMIEAGRGRWKIENEGFNNQKNGSMT